MQQKRRNCVGSPALSIWWRTAREVRRKDSDLCLCWCLSGVPNRELLRLKSTRFVPWCHKGVLKVRKNIDWRLPKSIHLVRYDPVRDKKRDPSINHWRKIASEKLGWPATGIFQMHNSNKPNTRKSLISWIVASETMVWPKGQNLTPSTASGVSRFLLCNDNCCHRQTTAESIFILSIYVFTLSLSDPKS